MGSESERTYRNGQRIEISPFTPPLGMGVVFFVFRFDFDGIAINSYLRGHPSPELLRPTQLGRARARARLVVDLGFTVLVQHL